MRIIVTGGAGFIGSHLVDKLIDGGHEVVVVDDLSGGFEENVHPGAKLIIADCRDYIAMTRVFNRFKPEIVYHLAANAAEGKSHFSPIDITTRSYDAFINVLVAGINNKMKRIVIVSSNAVYGEIKPPFKESDIPEPEDMYGLSKLMMEKTAEILSKVHDFEYVIARPHNVYGPRQNMTDPYRNVVTIWINSLLHDKPYTMYGDGSMQRCFTYVEDLVEGLYKLGFEEVNKEIFNLGADEPTSTKELSDMILKISKTPHKPIPIPARPREVVLAVPDHEKAKSMLGYKTKVYLEEGVKRTWLWAKEKGPQEQVFTDFEIDSPKIPINWRK